MCQIFNLLIFNENYFDETAGRMWPVMLGVGVGLGMALANCQINLNSTDVAKVYTIL